MRPDIEASAQAILDKYSAEAPAGVFADRVVVPEAISADHLLLEGERIEILPPMHGDAERITALHIPALDTLIATDFAYVDTHLWLAENTTPEAIAKWRASLDQLEAIGAGTVIPGHRVETSPSDAGVFAPPAPISTSGRPPWLKQAPPKTCARRSWPATRRSVSTSPSRARSRRCIRTRERFHKIRWAALCRPLFART